MTIAVAKQVFAHLMQVARKRTLRPTEKDMLMRARQTLRSHAKPAMNRKKIQTGDTVYHKKTKIKGYVQRFHWPHYWVRWADGEYSTVTQSEIRPVLAGPKGRLPNPSGTKIYGRCLRIEAVKTVAHTYGGKTVKAGQKYFHDFRSKNAMIYGMPDGSLWIKAK